MKSFLKKKWHSIPIIAGTIAIVLALVLTLSSVALALSFTVNPVIMTSDDGQIASVTVAPKINLEWEGLDQTPDTAVYEVYIKGPGGGWNLLGSQPQNWKEFIDGGTTGSASYTFPATEICGIYPYELLDADVDGTTTTTDLSIKVKAVLYAGGNLIISAEADGTFTVNCTNEPASLDTGGAANAVGTPTVTE